MSPRDIDLVFTTVRNLSEAHELAAATSSVLYQAADDAQTWACVHPPSSGSPFPPAFTGQLAVDVSNDVDPSSASMLVTLHYTIPEGRAADFEAWFSDEHAQILVEEPAWLSVRVVRGESRDDHSTHLVVHELADASALSSAALHRARETPDRARFAELDWFRGARTRQYARA
ncbi:hypothetical protein [Microtetraspora sp. NBRC 16547]|uniref:hypothetical protein n=1 Tax=Microtetraspora sp. NBRC 16547 TaxID=3030993 RepID=UPI0024A5A064|nr:hypothetical protein [Microtetraspora sp. NBRC 16547]GLW99354.1 hypothetical protein Misp02_34410 [Microtetraspora sp. NBRC 16547]